MDSQDSQEEEESDKKSEFWWHVNKSGFPICEETWEKMWSYVARIHPSGPEIAGRIRGETLKKVPHPVVPVVADGGDIPNTLVKIQQYMNELQYNHTGTQFFEIKKNRVISRLMESAREMIQESLPIKCLEAVILSLYLTSPLSSLQRFTIRFKTKFKGYTHRHVVLGVSCDGVYGALGMSRRTDLMYKRLSYKSVADLIENYIECYQNNMHTVCRVALSSPVVHDLSSYEKINWKFCVLYPEQLSQVELKHVFDKYTRTLRTL